MEEQKDMWNIFVSNNTSTYTYLVDNTCRNCVTGNRLQRKLNHSTGMSHAYYDHHEGNSSHARMKKNVQINNFNTFHNISVINFCSFIY